MQPITRKEMYLNRLAGQQAQAIPAEPITREEQYLGRLCGENNVIPEEPRTRKEIYLANLCGEDVTPPAEAITRIEQYMAFASGESESKPEKPITREEMYWDKYQGGEVPEEKTIAFTDIITVTDALARPAVDLQAEITATQNLNGYEYPWVGGAGKNKLKVTATTQTINDITFTVNSDGTISLSGTASNTTIFDVAIFSAVGGTAYKLSGCPSDGSTSKYLLSIPTVGYDSGSGYNYTPSTSADVSVRITIYSGQNTQGLVFKPMICLSSAPNPDYAHFEPYENICPISGRTEVNVTRTGKNLFDKDNYNSVKGFISDQHRIISNPNATSVYIPCRPNTTYTVSKIASARFSVAYSENVPDISVTIGGEIINPSATSLSITTGASAKYLIVFCYLSTADTLTFQQILDTLQIELGSTATAYEPYEGDTFNTELGRTVYGGTLDLTTGELTLTHAYVDLGDFTWTLSNVSNTFQIFINEKKSGQTNFITTSYRTVAKGYADLANGEATCISPMPHAEIYRQICIKDERATTPEEFTTLVTGQKMVYELATPQTISLTPTEVMMLENNNTIWADAGRVQLTYLSKAAQRVQSMNASLKANTLKITKAITGGVKA